MGVGFTCPTLGMDDGHGQANGPAGGPGAVFGHRQIATFDGFAFHLAGGQVEGTGCFRKAGNRCRGRFGSVGRAGCVGRCRRIGRFDRRHLGGGGQHFGRRRAAGDYLGQQQGQDQQRTAPEGVGLSPSVAIQVRRWSGSWTATTWPRAQTSPWTDSVVLTTTLRPLISWTCARSSSGPSIGVGRR